MSKKQPPKAPPSEAPAPEKPKAVTSKARKPAAKKTTSATKPYNVGKGRPPLHSRYPKGKSGNPSGRPKGSNSLKTDLAAERRRTHTITERGKPQQRTLQQIVLRRIGQDAAQGKPAQQAKFIDLILRLFGGDDSDAAKPVPLSAEDKALLRNYLDRKNKEDDDGE